jgi:hypothetical protein
MSHSASPQPAIEQRMLPRTVATGDVVIRAYDRNQLQGEMLDVSACGFRIRYVGKRMRIGSEVEVLHPWTNLKATVAWTIRSGEWIHAGFQLTPATDVPSQESPD